MPTAAKLFAALAFACLGYLASDVFKPLLPEGSRVGLLSEGNAALGFVIGWLVMGQLVGRGYWAAAGSGVRTSATLLFVALLSWSIWIMLENSTRLRYDGPMEAIIAVFDFIFQYGALFAVDPQVLIVLLVGGIFGGLFAEWASRRFN